MTRARVSVHESRLVAEPFYQGSGHDGVHTTVGQSQGGGLDKQAGK